MEAMPAHHPRREFDAIARRIEEALVQHALPSFAAAVARDGDILWEEGFALPDPERTTAPVVRFEYANLGHRLLGYAISRGSGRSYEDFLRQEVFLPLGLHRSAVGVPPELAPYAAKRYGADGLAYPAYDFDHRGASAVYASVHDLVRFGMFHLKQHLPDQKAILTDRSLDEMQVATARQDDGAGYGIGWRVYSTWVEHDGGMGGVSALLWMVPTAGLVVAAVTN